MPLQVAQLMAGLLLAALTAFIHCGALGYHVRLDQPLHLIYAHLGVQGIGSRYREDLCLDAADETPLPSLDLKPTMGAIRSAFLPPPLPLPEFDSPEATAGPNAVTFVYASSTQWNTWPWAPPDDQAILHLSSAVAKGREMEPNQLAFAAADLNLVRRLKAARHQNNVLILLVDGASLASAGLRERMRGYDGQQDPRLATMVIWNNNRDPDLERRMNETLTYFVKRAAPFFHSIEARDQFSDVLSRALDQLRIAVRNDPHHLNPIRAATEFSSLPAVAGPGQVGA
jgi:hypothetical protein